MKTLFFQMASTLLVIICMFSTFIYFVIKRKKVSKTLTNREDFFVKIGIGIILGMMFVKMFIPVILDIPYYLKNDFEIITGYARDNANGKGNIRHVTIIDEETEQEIYVEFSCSEGIDSGDYLKVKYLPYSRYGILLEKD
ncbi:hypothetical protein [Mediterraneibacter gnavus]|uniref:Uncharacterized protein n=1 Tax=Mediterraneibacter gnavus TaxID=33038 RepID=A0A9X3HHX1_MEDGN|nr:hypothetical protein [Mediterraneibacter gnavus]MCZ7695089.1 hypothetical protein [Mediterraneibacter gnavus]MCZ7736649.1 hypothetical protein [Mediterraneibacter gnavus]MDC6148280.1 hypothetical protein [Mediterraneibacter gnavus]MDE1201697.1 hypothetical protein [Mediterraneibacter gnavus]